ncbi:hypothetical protein OBBRIDRAFT_138705 [Obba rivulosa]|uniref:Uncharacterized protein n=1 Tax=Obba rivulosa TaxID=1052685 RepID=A0A8E2ATC4_9APHY|nr:hypothetical protein OBBRIDRAFT_138705 [Obba rivulosa]
MIEPFSKDRYMLLGSRQPSEDAIFNVHTLDAPCSHVKIFCVSCPFHALDVEHSLSAIPVHLQSKPRAICQQVKRIHSKGTMSCVLRRNAQPRDGARWCAFPDRVGPDGSLFESLRSRLAFPQIVHQCPRYDPPCSDEQFISRPLRHMSGFKYYLATTRNFLLGNHNVFSIRALHASHRALILSKSVEMAGCIVILYYVT